MKTGWLEKGGKKYYLDQTGVMRKGWIADSGQKYYLDNKGFCKQAGYRSKRIGIISITAVQ